MKDRLMVEAERERFEAQSKGEKPKLHITYGFSELDIFTNMAYTWDLWIKFPFAVSKEKCEELKKEIQKKFEQIFLA